MMASETSLRKSLKEMRELVMWPGSWKWGRGHDQVGEFQEEGMWQRSWVLKASKEAGAEQCRGWT